MHGWRDDIATAARGESKLGSLLYIKFAHTATSRAKAWSSSVASWRRDGRDAPTSDAARNAQRRDCRVGHPRPRPPWND